MNEFWIWFSTGVKHILDLQGYDHILFVSLLVLTFPPKRWGKLLILVTAFTVGHSIALALSTARVIEIHQPLVELLIALSILTTAVYNALTYQKTNPQNNPLIYGITLFFGLIHGLGFSYLLRSMLGKENNVFLPLLYFNTGLEVGQLIIVGIVLIFSLLLTLIFKWPFKNYKLVFVCIIGLIALKISVERLLDIFQLS
jgi:HupE/UreJ protein